jgi:hypothetical protein
MTVLYILGAGCSRNYDQYDGPISNLSPPLNSDFFQVAKKIIDHYGLAAWLGPIIGLDHLIRNLNRLYGYGDSEEDTTVFDDPRLTLEAVMNYFYLEHQIFWSYDPLGSGNHRMNTLNELLAYVLAETLRGPPCRRHTSLANIMRNGDVVWSFNYDILIDNALFAQNKLSDSGYVMRFDYTFDNGSWERTGDAASKVVLLKLHGSLNWLRCRRCGRNLLLRNAKSVSTPSMDARNPEIRCPKCFKSNESEIEPPPQRIIVPPAGLKNYLDTDITYLWRSAPSFCTETDRVVVIGYSFSDLDYELDMVLRTMVEQGTLDSEVPITIVNRRPESVRRKFSSIFPKSHVSEISQLDVFLNNPKL